MSHNGAPLAGSPDPRQLLWSAEDLTGVLRVSVATIWRWHSAERLPRPIQLSRGCTRWRADEIRQWIDAGCPDRRKWEAMYKPNGSR